MPTRLLGISIALVVVVSLSAPALGQEKQGPEATQPESKGVTKAVESKDKESKGKDKAAENAAESNKAKPNGPQVATFGGGCFWCTEAVCQRVPGVMSVVSGYSGGMVANPTYEAVCSGMTGHAECVQVVFNPAILSYEKLLEIFFRSHDPTTPNAQGPDFGTQYRSIIFYHTEDQRIAAEKVYETLKARRVLRGKVVTELVPFRAFFPAEPYHQNYYNNHPYDPYSLVYIEPKFDVFRKMMKGTAKTTKKSARGSSTLGVAAPKNSANTKGSDNAAAAQEAASSGEQSDAPPQNERATRP